MRKIKILSPHNPSKAYTSLKYITEALSDEKVEVQLFCQKDKDSMREWNIVVRDISGINILNKGMFNKLNKGMFNKIYRYLFLICFFSIQLINNDVLIINDIHYLPFSYLIKKINRKKHIIFYSTEYFDETFLIRKTKKASSKYYDLYHKSVNFFDLIIECESKRLEKRVKDFNIQTETAVILNTLPLSLVKEYEGNQYNLYEVAQIKPTNKPILVYTGAGTLGRNLNFIVDAIANVSRPINFVAFCYGSENDLQLLREYCQQKLGPKHDFKICDAITKNILLSITGQANAGICYYNPEESTNNNLAAPSKVYEYISQGLPVVCSNNPTMRELFETYPLGVCAKNNSNEAMTKAIETILFDQELITEIKSKNKQIFAEKLCFEEASKDAIEKILKVAEK